MTEETEVKETVEEEKSSSDMINRANDAADRLEQANNRMEENIKQMEVLNVERKLSGQAVAGEEPPKEISDEEYAEKALKGNVEEK